MARPVVICCLYGTEELEYTLTRAFSRVRAKVTADFTESICLELIPWDLGCGCHRELNLYVDSEVGRCH